MQEAASKCVVWPDVSKETFGRFAMFLYTGDYNGVEKLPSLTEKSKDGMCSTTRNAKDRGTTTTSQTGRFMTECPDPLCSHDDVAWPDNRTLNILMVHAHMYVLADYHHIESLKAAALRKLHRLLVWYTVTEDSLEQIVCLVQFTYENTLPCKRDSLRSMVSEYCASALIRFRVVPEVESLMRRLPDFAADMFQKLKLH
ncbi:hypothetical protein SPBR_09139 [Sporothrix brasiliensis 5110]|uniref:BTB domain-containing protein n=1 Tax=Sporothrix brasiliensis 5110 TaxID=1398154 RepID=A0A0C2ISS3_9PEZI|nr:uncharacterized protein SPBR_09139 [Sporothrix brasiliensis 5110]KIH92096.1 hypothetical protein SPBR_09139 [Sporothrix brasiliensis 5110]